MLFYYTEIRRLDLSNPCFVSDVFVTTIAIFLTVLLAVFFFILVQILIFKHHPTSKAPAIAGVDGQVYNHVNGIESTNSFYATEEVNDRDSMGMFCSYIIIELGPNWT